MKRLVTLVFVLLLAHAGWKVGPRYINYFQFKAELDEIARVSATKSQEDVYAQVVDAARASDIPVSPSGIRVRRLNERTLIDVSYKEELEILPGYRYPWDVAISVDSYVSKIRLSEIR